jgi:cytosine/adenosine deaminase-related metal-dependent hydrolase
MAGGPQSTIFVGIAMCRPGIDAPLGPAAIQIEDGRIAAIETVEAGDLPTGAENLLALPAPTNAHDHGRGLRTIGFGAGDDRLEAWLPALNLEPRSDPYLNAAVALARMAEGGIAATNHCHGTQDRAHLFEEAESVSRAARDVGIRVAFAVPFMNRNRGVYGPPSGLADLLETDDRNAFLASIAHPQPVGEMLAATERIAALEHEFFQVQYGPVGPQWVSDEALAAIAQASARTGRRIHMHFFETRRQRDWADAAYEGGLVRYLDAIGLLSPRLTLAHGVWLKPDECALLAERGVSISVNLSSNLRLGSGLPPVGTFREAGLGFGIGLDALSFDDDEDMLRETRLLWRHYRGCADGRIVGHRDVFDAALIHGRRTVLGDDGGGRLEAGAPADLMVLDIGAMSADFVRREVEIPDLLLTRATKRHLIRLVVAGRTVVEHGACVTVPLSRLEKSLTESAKAARAAAPADEGRIARMQQAVHAYYEAGSHKGNRN